MELHYTTKCYSCRPFCGNDVLTLYVLCRQSPCRPLPLYEKNVSKCRFLGRQVPNMHSGKLWAVMLK